VEQRVAHEHRFAEFIRAEHFAHPNPLAAGNDADGYVSYKYKLNNGAYSAETPISQPIQLTNLAAGTYTVFVIGKNDAGFFQADADATPDRLTIPLKPLDPGVYVLRYRVLAVDGHITEGVLRFTVGAGR